MAAVWRSFGHEAVKLDAIPTITADGENNKFNLSEAEGYSFPQGTTLFRVKLYETEANFTAPTDGTTFAAFFS